MYVKAKSDHETLDYVLLNLSILIYTYIYTRVHNFRGRGECPTLYTAAKHTALSYDAIRY